VVAMVRGFDRFGPGQGDGEDTVLEIGLRLIGLDIGGEHERAFDLTKWLSDKDVRKNCPVSTYNPLINSHAVLFLHELK
jgi:hypothetical protein